MLAVCGSAASRRSAPHPTAMPRTPPAKPKHSRFRLDQQHHPPALPPQRAQDADLARALKDRHRHGVGNAQDADQQRNGRCAPRGGMGQHHELVVAGALRRGNCAQARQRGFNLRLGALQIVFRRFTGRRRPQAHMKRRNLSLQAAQSPAI